MAPEKERGTSVEGRECWIASFICKALTFLALVAIFLLFIYPAVRRRKQRVRDTMEGAEQGPGSSEILDRRYTEGEISREEYFRMRADITKVTEEENAR